MPKETTVYSYSGCGTCRKALKWMADNGISPKIIPIREQPPKASELKRAIKQLGSLRPLFNTSGGDYKALALKDRIADMDESEAVELLSNNGNLVKRPFVLLPDGRVLVGFNAESYAEAFE
ncbi:MAG TPA: Spx/MgsR family RNA polymerase-binding regulatory protein [Polyangiaceae bacterium]